MAFFYAVLLNSHSAFKMSPFFVNRVWWGACDQEFSAKSTKSIFFLKKEQFFSDLYDHPYEDRHHQQRVENREQLGELDLAVRLGVQAHHDVDRDGNLENNCFPLQYIF